jgi:hypothetical protein
LNTRKKILLTVGLGLTWLAGIALGIAHLLNYETSPGEVGAVPKVWPANSAIQHPGDRPTLLMVAHPQCPCTRASMNELAQVVAHVQGKVRVFVLFYTPRNSESDWTNTGLRRTAAQIPDVTVFSDMDGAEAHLFGAETSGHTFLYDRNGHLLFTGGITASRGHSGDNVGESALISLINDQPVAQSKTLVFGCPLHDPTREAACLK